MSFKIITQVIFFQLVADLSTTATNEAGYLILGNGGAQGLRINNPNVKSWMKVLHPGSDFANNLFSDPARSPLAFALFYDIEYWMQGNHLSQEEPFYRFTVNDAFQLRESLIDLVVLDGFDPVRCDVIETLNPDWRTQHFPKNYDTFIINEISLIYH